MAKTQIGAESARVTYADISRACRTYGIAPSSFGRGALGDPRLVFDMLDGRTLRPATALRVRQFIAGLEG